MIVYSVQSRASFDTAEIIREKILNHLGAETIPFVLVGNKSDLRPEQRQVSAEDGKAKAEELNCAWTEASACYNENVAKAFELMIAKIEKDTTPNEPAGGKNCVVM